MRLALYEPQIPQNTGSIARTCAATATPLDIIGETPFEISEKTVRRAGLDYWPWVDLTLYETWQEYLNRIFPGGEGSNNSNNSIKIWAATAYGKKIYHQVSYGLDDVILLGSETTGLPKTILDTLPPEQLITIPMVCPEVRSINLSNAASIILYEARRQLELDLNYQGRERRSASKNY
jgi:tRNA (cytidine/uridine-2'-O-)-methyltransferase